MIGALRVLDTAGAIVALEWAAAVAMDDPALSDVEGVLDVAEYRMRPLAPRA